MPAFDYDAPTSVTEATALLAQYGDDAHLMAGGTSLVIMMKEGLLRPAHVVGLRGVAELRGIRRTPDGGLEIRALTTHREAERSEDVRAYCPALAEAFSRVATIRIRNQATVGGNLAHADPAQDPPPILLALGATVVVAGPRGERTIPLDAFFTGYFETALEPGEVLVAVQLPPLPAGTRATYIKFLPRSADDYATVSIAAALRLDGDGACQSARLALGSVANVPLRAKAAENELVGRKLTDEVVKQAAALVREAVDPLDDVRGSAEYKREMAGVFAQRAIRAVGGLP